MIDLKQFPILVIDKSLGYGSPGDQAIRELIDILTKEGYQVIETKERTYGMQLVTNRAEIGCVVISYPTLKMEVLQKEGSECDNSTAILKSFRAINPNLPIFLSTDIEKDLSEICTQWFPLITGYFYKLEDTSNFIVGRIKDALKTYVESLMTPFFKELLFYTKGSNYSWHTPGHNGGMAFRKSPVGIPFFNFYGENTFRADLSVSVPELGSLLKHSGVVNIAETAAAKIFGADRTYFVLNGTSTSNQILWHATVTENEPVLVDRNCHSSILHALIKTGANPTYLQPTRNKFGIIGPILLKKFVETTNEHQKIMVITNSTYDGLCYNINRIKVQLEETGNQPDIWHFDEAWFAYAKFNELYKERFGMDVVANEDTTIFTTHSIHKLLAAFSQASMIHVKYDSTLNAEQRIFAHNRFNESFMIHTSTSPQYSIIASLDVASHIMKNAHGKKLLQSALEEAIRFRVRMKTLKDQVEKPHNDLPNHEKWWFKIWQPDDIETHYPETKEIKIEPKHWYLSPNDDWHGFGSELEGDGYIMLDPLKVTILTWDRLHDCSSQLGSDAANVAIPASIVTLFLRTEGVVIEKTGLYSFLIFFSLGATKGKVGTLIMVLSRFKKHYDNNTPVKEIFPDLSSTHYSDMGLKDLCQKMHEFVTTTTVKNSSCLLKLMEEIYTNLPEKSLTPAKAYQKLVRNHIEQVEVTDLLEGRISAVQVAPYPPSIPVMMPGERISSTLVHYLQLTQQFNAIFPGFETEIHGVIKNEDKLAIICLREES